MFDADPRLARADACADERFEPFTLACRRSQFYSRRENQDLGPRIEIGNWH